MTYSYDNANNLLTRVDCRNITTTYTYDSLNRVSMQSYNDGVTWPVSYIYGDAGSVPNGKGRLIQVANAYSSTNYNDFDSLGEVTSGYQITADESYVFSYEYNLAGALVSERYPSGRTVATCYDGANRPSAVVLGSCAAPAKNYVSGVGYWPHGAPNYYTLGNNVWPVMTYNSRLQQIATWDAIGNNPNRYLFQESLNWGSTNENGTLQGKTMYAGGPGALSSLATFNQSYGYDTVNRLQTASDSGGWSRSYGYDPYGNMWVTGYSGIGLSPATPTSNIYNPANNRKTNESYDNAGNQTSMGGIYSFSYDAENRQVAESNTLGNPAARYVYDGSGQRVEKVVGGTTTVYVYDALGQLTADYTNAAAGTPPCQTCYLIQDHLGSTRLVTDQNANVVAFHD